MRVKTHPLRGKNREELIEELEVNQEDLDLLMVFFVKLNKLKAFRE